MDLHGGLMVWIWCCFGVTLVTQCFPHSAWALAWSWYVLVRMILSNFGLVACSKSCTVAPVMLGIWLMIWWVHSVAICAAWEILEFRSIVALTSTGSRSQPSSEVTKMQLWFCICHGIFATDWLAFCLACVLAATCCGWTVPKNDMFVRLLAWNDILLL